jgi:hypothetical protein
VGDKQLFFSALIAYRKVLAQKVLIILVPNCPSLGSYNPHSRRTTTSSTACRNFHFRAICKMELNRPEAEASTKPYFNGSVPIKRARMELSTTNGPNAAQIRRQKEAEKQYGRGRKVPGEDSICGRRTEF